MTADPIGSTEKVGTPSVVVSRSAIVLLPEHGKPQMTTSANGPRTQYLPRALVVGLGPA